MDFDELRDLFSRAGYRELNGRPEGITLFYRYAEGGFQIVIAVDLESRAQISPQQQSVLEEHVKNFFFRPQGRVPDFPVECPVEQVEDLILLVGSDMEQIQHMCSQGTNRWGYCLPQARLLIYENQPGDFKELRGILEAAQKPTKQRDSGRRMRDRRIWENVPLATVLLAAVNIMVFLGLEWLGDTESGSFIAEHGGLYPELIRERNQWWRILTSGFLHFGAAHLINNMVMLCCVGSRLERAVGPIKFLAVYLLSEVGGALLSCEMMFRTGDYAVSAGASGAVFGTITGLLWVVIFHKGRFEGLTARGLVVMLALSLYYGFSTIGVDNWGHIGGAVTGFATAAILYHGKRQTG